MKLDASWRDHGERKELCIRKDCRATPVRRVTDRNGTEYFVCPRGHRSLRRVVLDPRMKWRIAGDLEYWHESVGVFVRNTDRKFWFFRRTIHPVSKLTVASGHVDAGESALDAALRELKEESGLQPPPSSLTHIASEPIFRDSCRRGSDAHLWHAYLLVLDPQAEPEVSGEGTAPLWLTLAEVKRKRKSLTRPVKFIIDKYGAALAG